MIRRNLKQERPSSSRPCQQQRRHLVLVGEEPPHTLRCAARTPAGQRQVSFYCWWFLSWIKILSPSPSLLWILWRWPWGCAWRSWWPSRSPRGGCSGPATPSAPPWTTAPIWDNYILTLTNDQFWGCCVPWSPILHYNLEIESCFFASHQFTFLHCHATALMRKRNRWEGAHFSVKSATPSWTRWPMWTRPT